VQEEVLNGKVEIIQSELLATLLDMQLSDIISKIEYNEKKKIVKDNGDKII